MNILAPTAGLAVVLAAADPAPTDPYSALLNYGVLGLLALILIAFARAAYKRESDRADASDLEVRRLNAVIADKYVPALENATNAVRESTQAVAEVRAELARFDPPRRRPT